MKAEPIGMVLFKKMPFREMVKYESDLQDARSEFANKSAEERRMTADFEYNSEMASDLFNNALSGTGQDEFGRPYWPAGVMALAIRSSLRTSIADCRFIGATIKASDSRSWLI